MQSYRISVSRMQGLLHSLQSNAKRDKTGLRIAKLQVGSHWGQHAMAAPGDLWRQVMTSSQKLPKQLTSAEPHRLSHHLSSVPKAAGALLTRTGLWLLEGLESVGELAGLSSEPAGQDLDMPSLPGLCCCLLLLPNYA